MSRRSLALASCLVASIVVVGCQEPTAAPVTPSAPELATARSSGPALARGWPSRSLTLPSSLPSVDRVFAETGPRAIDPDDYVCSNVSQINGYLNAELNNTLKVEPTIFWTMYDRYADYLPTYDALYFQTSATPQTFGYSGQFTQVMVK